MSSSHQPIKKRALEKSPKLPFLPHNASLIKKGELIAVLRLVKS